MLKCKVLAFILQQCSILNAHIFTRKMQVRIGKCKLKMQVEISSTRYKMQVQIMEEQPPKCTKFHMLIQIR